MAIKVSSKLIEDITAHINEMRDTAIKSEFGSTNDAIPFSPCHEDAEAMDAMFWGEHLHLKSQMPTSWCDSVKSDPSDRYGSRIINVFLDSRAGWPCCLLLDTKGLSYYAAPKSFGYRPDIVLKNPTHPRLRELYDTLHLRKKVSEKWEGTRKKVLAVLNASPSLNQAAKVWPEIVHFLPSERKEQYQKDIAPKVRKKADISELEAAVAEIDREAMAGDLVAYRFLTN